MELRLGAHKINEILYIDRHSPYKDDVLFNVPDNKKANDKIRKILFTIFHYLKLGNHGRNEQRVQYLDVEFNHSTGIVSPYMMPKTIGEY